MTVELNWLVLVPGMWLVLAFVWWCGWDHRGDVEWRKAHESPPPDSSLNVDA